MIGRDNLSGPWPALDDVDARRLSAALDAGVPPRELAVAYGISRRTVHRYRGARLETIDVGGYPVTFLVFRLRPPVQVSRRGRPRRRT